ncbi:DUF2332 family protein [Arthrobacter sp. TMN-37]
MRTAPGVAGDAGAQALVGGLPPAKRLPSLVFAAARSRGAPLADHAIFRRWLLSNWQEVAAVIRTRSTQTNEAGRCAVLVPQLAAIDGPVALLEVGASAGLCLYPDRYSYTYQCADGPVRLHAAAAVAAAEPPRLVASTFSP